MGDELSEDEIGRLAWDLETKMMEIRKDPRAALTAELAKIRATMLAEYKADMAKKEADLAKEFAALKAARTATFEAEFAALTADLCGACAENLRQRATDAAKAAGEKHEAC